MVAVVPGMESQLPLVLEVAVAGVEWAAPPSLQAGAVEGAMVQVGCLAAVAVLARGDSA